MIPLFLSPSCPSSVAFKIPSTICSFTLSTIHSPVLSLPSLPFTLCVYIFNPYPARTNCPPSRSPHRTRWNDLAETFTARFGHPPTHIARAPGRVNIIGEHIDYALFGVFPAAVEQDILIACAPAQPRSPPHSARPTANNTPGVVKAQNLSPKYGPQNFAPIITTYVELSVA